MFIDNLRKLKYSVVRAKYLFLGYKIGINFVIGQKVNIDKNGFSAGHNVYIGPYCYIGPKTKIGNFCMLSDNVNIVGSDHIFEEVGVPTIIAGRPQNQPTTVLEDDVWIGHGVTIIRGIIIGEGSIVGANSVVTKNVPSYCIYAGIPAKLIRKRFKNDDARSNHSSALSKLRK
jgi:acetyltransferase-like isoleucine patch superfamily enzyme